MAKTRFVAKALLLDSQNNFLLLTRSDSHPVLAGFYDLPGGMVETNEEPGAATVREIGEETGIEITLLNIRALYTTTMMINGRSWPTLLYASKLSERPEVMLSYEHKAYDWVPLDRLQEVEPHLAPTYRTAFEYVRNNNILEDIDWMN